MARNALALLGAYVLPRAFTFASAVVAARVLGVRTFGLYGTVAALAVILSIASTLGMMQLLVREMAREPERAGELLGAAHLLKAASGTLMLAALAAATMGPLAYPPEAVGAALLLGASYAVGSWVENLGAWVQARERMGAWTGAQAAFGLVAGGSGAALVLGTGSLVWFCAAPLLGQLAALAWLLRSVPTPLRRAWGAPWSTVVRLLRGLVPFAVSAVVLTAYYKVGVLLVEWWRGAGEAGLYAAAYKFVDVAHALALVVAMAVYPRLSRRAPRALAAGGHGVGGRGGRGGEAGRWAATRVVELLLLAAVPAAALLWLLRRPLVGFLFGGEYAAASAVLGLLAPALPFLALNAVGSYVLAAAGRMGAVAGLFTGGLVLGVGLCAALVPPLGARGAALAMLGSETALAAGMLLVMRRHAAAPPSRRVVAAAAAAAAAAALAWWSPLGGAGSAVAYLAVAAAIYAGARVLPTAELRLLREAVGP